MCVCVCVFSRVRINTGSYVMHLCKSTIMFAGLIDLIARGKQILLLYRYDFLLIGVKI